MKEKERIEVTRIFFVRHAQPEHTWEDDRTRPLTEEGKKDSRLIAELLKDKAIDVFYCSPYKRSIDTIAEAAGLMGKTIQTDERFREREQGPDSSREGALERRWADFNYHEEGGESIGMVQDRNMAALREILAKHEGENIVIGTHGTALSSILNYYNQEFSCEDFLRIVNWTPYIIEFDFQDRQLAGIYELGYVEK